MPLLRLRRGLDLGLRLGRLFRSHAEQTIKKNLLIFVTGRLITPSGRELTLNEETAETSAEVKAAPKAE